MLCVEIPQVQYIDVSELVHYVEICDHCFSVHLNLSTLFVITSWEPRCTLNGGYVLGFGTQKKCPSPLK